MPTLTKNADNTYTYAAPATTPNPFASAPVSTPSPISVTGLMTPQTPLNVTPSPVVPAPNISAIPVQQPAGAPAIPDAKGLITSVDSLFNKYQNKEGAEAQAVSAATLPYQKQLDEINAQIGIHQANALANQEKVRASGGDVAFQAGEGERVARNDAIEALRLSAIAQAYQANIATAEKQAKSAVDAQYAQIESDLRASRQNIINNYETFNEEEKKRANATLLQMDRKDAFVAEQKQAQSDVLQIAIQAAQNGADTATIQKITQSPDATTALSIAGRVLGEPFRQKVAQQQFENSLALRDQQLQEQVAPGNAATATVATDLTGVLGSNKISQTTKTALSTTLGVINAAEDLAKNLPADGTVPGYYPGASIVNLVTPKGLKRDSTIKVEGYVDAINLKVQQWASGASLTKQQIDQVNKLVPAKDDSDRTFKTKLTNLVNFMNQQIKSSLQSEGIDYQPQTVDLFASTKTLEDIFK